MHYFLKFIFGIKLCMFWTVSLSIIRCLAPYTQQQVYVICYADTLLASCQRNVYVLLFVQCYTSDDGQRNCLKHVEFYTKNKFEKLVHLAGFIIKIYHDARSSECQIHCLHVVLMTHLNPPKLLLTNFPHLTFTGAAVIHFSFCNF